MTTQTATPAIREISQGVWKAQSKSHPAASHTVRRTSSGILSCTCPATRKCWHIKEIETMSSSKPEPTFVPVSDPPEEDFWADRTKRVGPEYVPAIIRTQEIVKVRPDFSEDFYQEDFS